VPAQEEITAQDEDMEVDDDKGMSEDEMGFIGNFTVADSLGRLEPTFDDEVSTMLLDQIGSVGRSHKREARTAARRLVTEVYSPSKDHETHRREQDAARDAGIRARPYNSRPCGWPTMGFQQTAQADPS